MMTATSGIVAEITPVFAARGRGIAKLLEGDPVAWSILGVVVVIFGGIAIYKRMNGSD